MSDATSAKAQSIEDKKAAALRTAQIAWTIREQIKQSLPTPEEQFLTIMVPGKVINFKDYISADSESTLNKDIDVQIREAMLVDEMPATGGVQLAPTGRSIADAYSSALDLLVAKGTIIGVEVGKDPKDPSQIRFQTAMNWLSTPNSAGKTKIDLYVGFQRAYAEAVEAKGKAYGAAMAESRTMFPDAPHSQDNWYNQWVQDNYKVYENMTQAAYMKWVIHGFKEEVEYYFALVDNTSPNSLIEKSKERVRNSLIATTDGSAEYNRVYLEPSNWATIAQQAADATLVHHGRSPDDIQFDIDRLKFKKIALQAMFPSEKPVGGGDTSDPTDAPITDAITKLVEASRAYDAAHKAVLDKKASATSTGSNDKPKDKPKDNDQGDTDHPTDDKQAEALATARQDLLKAQTDYAAKSSAQLRAHIADEISQAMSTNAEQAHKQIEEIDTQLTSLKAELDEAVKALPPSGPLVELTSDPKPAKPAGEGTLANYWTRITCEVASTYQAAQQHLEATSYSVGGAASWGLFTTGGSYSHSDASGKAASQMSNLACSMSFDVMRVDITRPWLQANLFYDARFDTTPLAKLSPGPFFLQMLIEQSSSMPKELNMDVTSKSKILLDYDLFSHYSTGFLLAANIVLELKGETSDIASYFSQSQTSASISVGYGPFSVSGSYSHSESDQSSTYQTTSEGCRITIKAPQIIGWVSEIVPALPRLGNKDTPFPVSGWTGITP